MPAYEKNAASIRKPVNRRIPISERRALSERADERISKALQEKKYAVIYCRVSEERSAENNLSIPDQEKQCKRLAAEEGWTVIKVYKEEGKSAKSTNGRPVFNKMIHEALSGESVIHKVIVHSTSRFARNQGDYISTTENLFEKGIEVVSVTQRFTKDTGGFIAQSASVMFDEYHSQRTSIDVSRTMRRWHGMVITQAAVFLWGIRQKFQRKTKIGGV